MLTLINIERHFAGQLKEPKPELLTRWSALRTALLSSAAGVDAFGSTLVGDDLTQVRGLLSLADRWTWARASFTHTFHGWSTISQPKPLVFDKLVELKAPDPALPEAYSNARKRVRGLLEQLKYSVSAPIVKPTQGYPAEREFAKADYIAAVERAKRMIEGGDFMQVQVGQRIKKRFTESPLSLYRALRSLNPSPYMYYYHFGDFHVVGASPEILVRQERTDQGQKITIRPLAGTRPRASSLEADKAAEVELVNDPKERAEHVMLIDLARNDIGRIAKTGTVKVTEAFAVERYSHVMHIVSNVEGILNDGMTNMDVLKATFPAGTLTGAPKVHAMQVIDQLEPSKRGLYGGACGYISYAGDMDVAIAIRTGIVKDGMLYVQAAAGVVADSVPELEWRETEAKARALLRASELVEEGLE